MKVYVLCEFSGIVREAFAKLGHDAWSCDLEPSEIPGKHFQGDCRELDFTGVDLVIAHPPCTYLTVTGNKWFKPEYRDRFPDRERQRRDAIMFFLWIASLDVPRIAIENPANNYMNTRYERPSQVIQPYMFGHSDRKATGLWLKNLPKLVATVEVSPVLYTYKNGFSEGMGHFTTRNLPSVERTKSRSRTFRGIARAMAEQWGILG